MNIYVITYDRPGPFRSHVEFLDAIRQLGPRSIRPMERTWMVGTNLTPAAMQQRLQPFLDQPSDGILINQLTYYQGWLPQAAWDWVNEVSQEYLP